MSDNQDSGDENELPDLIKKVRDARKAHPNETEVERGYRERLTQNSRVTHLREGKREPEKSASEKIREARSSEAFKSEVPPIEETEAAKAYRERMHTLAKKHYRVP